MTRYIQIIPDTRYRMISLDHSDFQSYVVDCLHGWTRLNDSRKTNSWKSHPGIAARWCWSVVVRIAPIASELSGLDVNSILWPANPSQHNGQSPGRLMFVLRQSHQEALKYNSSEQAGRSDWIAGCCKWGEKVSTVMVGAMSGFGA